MDTALFVAGGVALLLLFGCTGARENAPAPPPAGEAGEQIGDKDLATTEPSDEDALAGEDILIPTGSDILLDESDIFVDEVNETDAISEEDILLS